MKKYKISVFLLLFSLIPCFPVDSSHAWENLGTHPAINKYAIEIFEKEIRVKNPLLAKTSLNGAKCSGIAWDPQDGTCLMMQNIAKPRTKHLREWLIDGGFSADEPEIPMGLRHFYNPVPLENKNAHWLTDTHGVAGWTKAHLTPGRDLPEIDAITWAVDFKNKGDNGAYGIQKDISISQDYSWHDAKEYFRKALADDNRDNENYGKTWRSVGEVMHLMADMAVPAHVRNDGHMRIEPLERDTNSSVVKACSKNAPARSINYNTGIKTLMKSLATWTNKNFFSQDTVPIPGQSTTANSKPAYPSPRISKPPTSGSYVYRMVDGRRITLACRRGTSLTYRWFIGRADKQEYQVDDSRVIKSQQSILIPTAIRACAQVINRFLPRFEIRTKVVQSEDNLGTSSYSIYGTVKQHRSYEWPKTLIIKNGVYLVVNGTATKLPKRIAGGNFNEFNHDFQAEPNDKVWLRYDLGGYVIESNKVTIEPDKKEEADSAEPPVDTSKWQGGTNGIGSFSYKRKPVTVPATTGKHACCGAEVWATLSVRQNSSGPRKLEDIQRELKNRAKKFKKPGRASNHLCYGLPTVSPFAIDNFKGYILEVSENFCPGWASPGGYVDARASASGSGWILVHGRPVQIQYSAGGSGCYDNRHRAFLEGETKASLSEVKAVLSSLHFVKNDAGDLIIKSGR
jgi:hypothetical protein